ncbi:MAG TPA: hypothetical protein PLD25_25975 [Chloroflexota bacterium]|nr:hypothetical protein [Chloroflexota bacterium]
MNTKKIVVGILGLGLLAAVAALAMLQLFAPGAAAVAQTNSGQPEMMLAVSEVVNGESYSGEVRVSFAEAAGLPTTAPAALGLFLKHSGDTLTLGAGPIEVEVAVERVNDEPPTTNIQASHGGDEVTVLVTEDTAVYADTTASPHITPEDITAGHKTIARTIAPGSLDDIGENMIVRVWGTEQNGQLVADVLVYELIK